MSLPRVHIVGNQPIAVGIPYRVDVGYDDNQIVSLALSATDPVSTLAQLYVEVPGEFHASTMFVEVKCDAADPKNVPEAHFWSDQYHDRELYNEFVNDDTAAEWSAILGASVSFDPPI